MDESLSAEARVVPITSIRLMRGEIAGTRKPHELLNGRGPYWCDKTKKFTREVRVLDGHAFCSECPTQIIGVRGILGLVTGVDLLS